MRTLEEKLEQVKKDTNEVDDRNNVLSAEIVKLEAQKQDQVSDFALAEQ